MANLPTKEWLDICVDSLDLPGSPWHSAKKIVLKRLVKKLEEKHLFDESQLVLSELEDGISMLPHDSDENKRIKEKLATREKMMKAFISIAAREAGYSATADKSNQTQTCVNLVNYIQGILKVNFEALFGALTTSLDDNTSAVEQSGEIRLLGTVLSRVLEKDPRQLHKISLRLKGCLIPDALRQSFYQLTLQRMLEDNYGARKQEEKVRQEFADNIKLGMTKLETQDPTKSPVQHMIHTAIIESYETFPGLARFSKDMKFQKSSSAILNILYTATEKFKYEYILWLFPLHVAAQRNGSKEHLFELAMQLDCFTSCCFEMSDSHNILLDVWRRFMGSRLERVQRVIQHFENIGVDTSIDKVERILQQDMGSTTENADYPSNMFKHRLDKFDKVNNSSHTKSFFAVPHPILCIRHWIRYLFVGSTVFPVTMFLFDQFFLYSWEHDAIFKACLSMISMLSDSIMEAATVEEMCTKMLMETKHVEVSDLQLAWKHVAQQHQDF